MSLMRPKSAPKSTCTHGKPLMQTIYKQRSGSRSIVNTTINDCVSIASSKKQRNENFDKQVDQIGSSRHIQDRKDKNRNKNKYTQKKRSNSLIIEPHQNFDEQMKKTTNFIMNQNFRHHNPQLCVCSDCTCGRHLCKLHAVSPNLTKTTTYAKDFRPKSATPNKVFIATQYNKLEGPHLQMNSSYLKEYPQKRNDDLSRPKPEDNLKASGPIQNLTSYTSEFPGHKGQNQYVKPTDKHRREKFPLRGRSTYNDSFLGSPALKDDWDKVQDNLKTGSGWFGQSSYNNFYKVPNPQYFANKVTKKQKLQINPDYKRQFETSYGNDFIKHANSVCPAKISLESKKSGEFRNSKNRFTQNADFKAMSPEFRSYSANRAH